MAPLVAHLGVPVVGSEMRGQQPAGFGLSEIHTQAVAVEKVDGAEHHVPDEAVDVPRVE